MATFKFFTTGSKNPSTIYVRFTNGRKLDVKRSTSLVINPLYWNPKKGEVKQTAQFSDKVNFQNRLNDLHNYLVNSFNSDYAKGMSISGDWLEEKINLHFERKDETDLSYLYEYCKYYIKNLPNKVQPNGTMGVSLGTIKKYKSLANKIKEFETYSKKRVLLSDVNMKFHRDKINFMHDVQKLNFKTTGKYLTFIKTICRDAERHGFNIHPDLNKPDFRPTNEKTLFITLSEDEIDLIYNFNFKRSPYLENARNWLIIGVWTGARGGDLLNLTDANLHDGYIEYTAQKTGQKIIIPLHSQVEAIVNRLGGFPHKISQQRFNDYIKIVCKEVGLTDIVEGAKNNPETKRKVKGKFPKWELVTSHVCRRSFATNHYGKLPTPVLMAITGHKTERMLLNYIGKTAKDSADVLKEYWKEQERNKGKHLQVISKASSE